MCCSVECLGAHISRRTQHVRAGTCLDAIGSTRGRSRSGGDFKHRWAPGWRLNREGTLHPARARPSPLTAGRRGCPLGQGDAAGAGAHTGVRMRDAPPPQLRASTYLRADRLHARALCGDRHGIRRKLSRPTEGASGSWDGGAYRSRRRGARMRCCQKGSSPPRRRMNEYSQSHAGPTHGAG